MKNEKPEQTGPAPTQFNEKLVLWLMNHRAKVSIVVGGLIICGLVYMIYDSYQSHVEKDASAALYSMNKEIETKLSKYEKSKEELDQAEMTKNLNAKDKKAKAAPAPESKITKLDLDKAKDELVAAASGHQALLKTYAGSRAATSTGLRVARILSENGKGSEAQEILRTLLGKLKSKDTFFGLVSYQLATILADAGSGTEALVVLEGPLQNKDQKFLHSSLLLKKAQIYISTKNFSKAKEVLENLSKNFPESPSAQTGKGYLRWLKTTDKETPKQG